MAPSQLSSVTSVPKKTYLLTRLLLLRYIAFIYAVAFLVALQQNEALIGTKGLLPAHLYLRQIHEYVSKQFPKVVSDSLWKAWHLFETCPTFLWFMNWQNDPSSVDWCLKCISTLGLILSLGILITGCANMIIMFSLWILYHSIVNVGQRWYSFGWESQLLETGFLAIFLCPLYNWKRFSKPSPTFFIVIMLFRWLIFRIMLGAGLIKIRGDQCWRDLTCMDYHYETQPNPNPLAFYLHKYPPILHKVETGGNHLVELIFPWLLLMPRPFALVSGLVQIFFQVMIIISGNLSFLNWLTIAPCIACFDDAFLLAWLPFTSHQRVAYTAEIQAISAQDSNESRIVSMEVSPEDQNDTSKRTDTSAPISRTRHKSFGVALRMIADCGLALLIGVLSVSVVQNLLSSRQIMNTSFDSLRIVNTYGAFGSITKVRHEVILLGTDAADPHSPTAQWREYEFNCKPGNITRRPCLISPYHYRLDWLMWFAAFQTYESNPWLLHLTAKLLRNDPLATSLLAHNPFINESPPKWIRADLYRYSFASWKGIGSKEWWQRKYDREYVPPVNLKSLERVMRHFHWT